MKLDFENTSEEVRIELIPLIDVIFCILIFFILAALQLTRQQAININLPQSNTSALQNRQTLIVSIDSIGQLYVDRTPVSEDQLYLLLEGYHRTNPQGLMLLNADRSAIYDDVVRALDLMRAVGGDRVALATQPGQNATDPSGLPGLPDGTQAPANDPASETFPGIPGLDAPATPGLDAPVFDAPGLDLPGAGTAPTDGIQAPGADAPALDEFADPGEINAPGDVTSPGADSDFNPDELIPPEF